MSSLAKQLKQLQIPGHISGAAATKFKTKASLLFDAKEAADIDNETIYSLGINGLEELKAIEPSFANFESTLFSESSKSIQRTLQTKEFNEKLDKQISKLLSCLSPYILLKPAQKILEWLIRRFGVQIYNVNQLVCCILPYHETKLFARVIQILSISDPSAKWHWLEPLQKSGSPLPRSAVVQHCISDPGFLSLICEMVPQAIENNCSVSSIRVLFTFYASTLVAVVEQMKRVTEEFITMLLPYLVKGLKSGTTELKAASYMIVGQLCVKCSLEERLLKSVLESVCKHLSTDLVLEGLMCVACICHTQNVTRLPKKAFRNLVKFPGLAQHLSKLSTTHDVQVLLNAFLPQLVTSALQECTGDIETHNDDGGNPLGCLLEDIVKGIELDNGIVSQMSRGLLDGYIELRRQQSDNAVAGEALKLSVGVVMKHIDRRYPTQLEKALEDYLEDLRRQNDEEMTEDDQSSRVQWVMEFVSIALSGVKSQVLPDTNATLVLSLHHPQAEVREMAVKHLGEMMHKQEKAFVADERFLSDSILPRLSDDDPGVVLGALNIGDDLLGLLPADVLADKLFGHLRNKKDGWDAVRESSLNFLVNNPPDDLLLLDRIVFELISFLFLHPRSCDEGIAMAGKLAGLNSLQHPFISGLKAFLKKKEWKSCNGDSDHETLAAANSALFCWFGDKLAKLEKTRQLDMVTSMVKRAHIQSEGSLLPLIFCGILGRLVCIETREHKPALCKEVFVLVNAELQKYTSSESLGCSDDETSSPGVIPMELMTNLVKYKAKSKRPKKLLRAEASILMWLLGILVKSIPCVKSASIESWWQLNSDGSPKQQYTEILLSIFEVLAFGAGRSESPRQKSAFQELLKQFFKIHLSDKLCLLRFLGLTWCDKPQGSATSGFPAVLQIQSLHIASVCLGSVKDSDLKEIVKDSCTVVPSLLIGLCSPLSAVRKSAITCLRNVATQAAGLPASPVSYLVNNLLENAEDLSADPDQLQRVFTSLFIPLSDAQSVSDKTSAKVKAKRKAEEKAVRGVLNLLTQHAVGEETPFYVRKTLLCALSDVATESFLLESLPLINTLLEKLKKAKLSLDEAVCLQQLIKKFTPNTVSVLDVEPDAWRTLVAVILCQKPLLHQHVGQGFQSPLSVILDQISNELFKSFQSESIKQDLLKLLLDILLKTSDASLNTQIKAVLLRVYVDANKIVKELCRPFEGEEKKESKKKKMKRNEEEEGQSAVQQWQRVVGLLEVLVQKDNISHPQQLVPTLFALLSRCIETDVSDQPSMDYTKQLLLSMILNVCTQLSPDGKPVKPGLLSQEQFDVERIVQCIRVSQNPQTHHHALLLLATAAQLFPEKVLHNVMSIFTFMGANVLRQDDSYSFQIITKTVETVIPALIKAGEKQQIPRVGNKGAASLDDSVAMVIRVFVDASPHVPEHRRLPLFTHLVSTVGASRFLYATIVLILERFIVHGAAEEDVGPVQNPLDVDFCVSLCQYFELHMQVEAMLKLIKYVVELPSEKPAEEIHRSRTPRRALTTRSPPHLLFDYHIHTAKQFRQFKFTLLGLIPTLLADEQFISKVMDLKEQTKSSVDSMFHSILETSLSFMTVTAKLSEQHSQDAGGKFWKAVLHRAYDIVDKVNQLLPLSAFVGVIGRLIHNTNATVRRKAMELLNTNLTQGGLRYSGDQVEDILGLVDELVSVVKRSGDGEEVAINKQTALYSLKLLTKLLAAENPQPFKKVIVVTTELFSVEDFNIQVASSALLCLAEVCSSLKVHAITYLPQFMPPLLSLMQNTGRERNDLLLLCAVTALRKVAGALPHFLSPYLVEVLSRVTCPRLEGERTDIADAKGTSTLTQLQENLQMLRSDLAKTVTPRVLIPAVSQCYLVSLNTSKESICTLMNMLGECILGVKREDVKHLHSQLFAFFLTALDFRVKHEKAGEAVVERTEESVINAFLTLVMKLSEATFRPMFLKLVDWATRNDSLRDRLLVFYRLCDRVADKLKSLFVLFAGYIVKNCVHLLDANNSTKSDVPFFLEVNEKDNEEGSKKDGEESSKKDGEEGSKKDGEEGSKKDGEADSDEDSDESSMEEDSDEEEETKRSRPAAAIRKSCMLINWVLDCLNKCFLYDTQGFVDKERFESLLQPLADQLENSLGGAKAYQERVTSHVVPCLAQFAVAAGDVHWKALNYQVLLKTRHPSSQVRFAALKVLEEFNNRLGEDFMVLLPETIPFLAELMEDECVEVEQQCQHVISEMEAVLGESLQKYF